MVVVQDADAGLGTVEMSWFSACLPRDRRHDRHRPSCWSASASNLDADQPASNRSPRWPVPLEVTTADENDDSGAEVDAATEPAPDRRPTPARIQQCAPKGDGHE